MKVSRLLIIFMVVVYCNDNPISLRSWFTLGVISLPDTLGGVDLFHAHALILWKLEQTYRTSFVRRMEAFVVSVPLDLWKYGRYVR